MMNKTFTLMILVVLVSLFHSNIAFTSTLDAHSFDRKSIVLAGWTRRETLKNAAVMTVAGLAFPPVSHAGEFTPGGTLVDREVGVQVGNAEASASRRFDNTNVLFVQDHFFKFGVAAPWVPPGSTEFPKTMPFVPSQQRYDNLKKYAERVKRGVTTLVDLKDTIKDGEFNQILPPDAPEYQLRPMGLLANGMMASENTGTTNELFLARWYVNEIYLDITDIRNAKSKDEALQRHKALMKAVDSYYGLLNRVITAKVGDPFPLLAAQ